MFNVIFTKRWKPATVINNDVCECKIVNVGIP